MYGVAVGYDFDFGGAVVGADAELTDSTADVDFENGGFEGDIADSVPFDVDLDRHQLVASYGFRFRSE
jgi:hypothetical protein